MAAWSVRQLPDQNQAGPDRSGCCLIKIRQQPDQSGCCQIEMRQLPDWSGPRFLRSLVCSVHCTVWNVQCAVCMVRWILYNYNLFLKHHKNCWLSADWAEIVASCVQSNYCQHLHTAHCTQHTANCTQHTANSTILVTFWKVNSRTKGFWIFLNDQHFLAN